MVLCVECCAFTHHRGVQPPEKVIELNEEYKADWLSGLMGLMLYMRDKLEKIMAFIDSCTQEANLSSAFQQNMAPSPWGPWPAGEVTDQLKAKIDETIDKAAAAGTVYSNQMQLTSN